MGSLLALGSFFILSRLRGFTLVEKRINLTHTWFYLLEVLIKFIFKLLELELITSVFSN